MKIALRASVAALLIAAASGATITAAAHAPSDPLHGGTGVGVRVLGHTDLGGGGLNGHVDVLDNIAFVGQGTNGGFAAQWNKTPTCKVAGGPTSTIKVVDLSNRANPTVVSTISVGDRWTLARDVDALKVKAITAGNVYTGNLLAVAKEACNANFTFGRAGVDFYDVTNPATPVRLGTTVRTDRAAGKFSAATRQVTLVQRPSDGKVLALEANQQGATFGGGIHIVDVTNPATPTDAGHFGFASSLIKPFQECRPFVLPQGVSSNDAGTRAYVSYQDQGALVLDISNPSAPTVLSQTQYDASEEGNTFRFVPRGDVEDMAAVTDDDVHPARTTLTVGEGLASEFTEPGGSDAGVFRGCEAIWGNGEPNTGPLFERTNPSITGEIVTPNDPGGCRSTSWTGKNVAGNIALVVRGGALSNGFICGFEEKARFAQAAGAAAVMISNTATDHHGGAAGFLFSVDSISPADGTPNLTATTPSGDITLPVVFITLEAGGAIRDAIEEDGAVTATLADNPDTWGALRLFDLTGATPQQTAVVNQAHSTVLTPDEGMYHAVNPMWAGKSVLTAWMSEGLRVTDAKNPSAPKDGAFYVPPAAADPTGNYPAVPLVVDVARVSGSIFVISDINGGLYVLDVALAAGRCASMPDPQACYALFDHPKASSPGASSASSHRGANADPDGKKDLEDTSN